MNEYTDNLEAAIYKAAAEIADAKTLEEAIEWNRILSNLTYIKTRGNDAVEEEVTVVPVEPVDETNE